MGRPRGASIKRPAEFQANAGVTAFSPTEAGKERMVHIRVSPELHRKLRLIVAARDTSLQEWIAQMLEAAVLRAWPEAGGGTKS